MKTLKLILIAAGLILATVFAFSIVGLIYSALFYIFLLGIVAIGGAVGYKLLINKNERRKLNDPSLPVVAELRNTDRALEEYKRKYLSE